MPPNHEMILLARESRGITQTDLARTLGFSQARLSKMEDNLAPITSEDVTAIAAALNYPITFFYRRDMRREAFNGLYRRRKSLALKFLSQFNALVSIRAARVDRLARKESVMKSELPSCDPDEYDGGATEIAAHVRQFLGIPPGPIKDLIDILEDHGVIIIRQDFGSAKIDGVSIFTKDGRPVIFLNSAQQKSRQIFTLVHEVAHMVMHRLPRPTDVSEPESDAFTAEFLMPADDIRPQFQSVAYVTIEKLQSLKLHWNVSIAALLRRAKDLGFVDAKRYTSLNVMMSQRGYRRVEPHEEYIKLGEPTFERELIEFHLHDLGYSEDQLRDFLDMNPMEFRNTYPHERGGLRVIK